MSFQHEEFSWTPSIETGLSGEKYLSETVGVHVDGGPTEANAPGIYIIEHSKPDGGVDVHEAMWARFHETVPSFITAIADAERLVYVGAGDNVYGRIKTHVNADPQANSLAEAYPVHGVMNIILTETVDDAFTYEQQVMFNLREQHPNWHVRSA